MIFEANRTKAIFYNLTAIPTYSFGMEHRKSEKRTNFNQIIDESREKGTYERTTRDSFRGKKAGTGDSPEIGEMSPETGPGRMLLLGISEESDAKRNRNLKTTWLVSLACASLLLNENLVET